mmetsp:Transcript_25911/g.28815  ORF Transcript_25911/g.28815 Transcript_25911/m.28815 type:complete len:381 (+) Transcript_25911:19-1161(+)
MTPHFIICCFLLSSVALGAIQNHEALFRLPLPTDAASDLFNVTFLTEAAKTEGAICIDGTPGAYYFRPGSGSGANKWYIHHEGGGWCESSDNCYGRSLGRLGSSKSYTPTMALNGGYFSNEDTVNPMMYNWNMVYLKYCDGGSFSGNREDPDVYEGNKLYYRGKRVLNAMHASLMTTKGLDKATDVVISGCSAGGLATYFHVDWWAENLPKMAKVRGLPDSGFFLDFEGPPKYHSGMQWVFKAMNSTSGVNQACIKAYEPSGQAWRCIFAQYTAPFITTPIFPLQSEYDSWQTANDLGSTNDTLINDYGASLTYLVKQNLLVNPIHGIFLDSCHHHCGEWGDIKINGDTQAIAFQKFYEGDEKTPYIQGAIYPCKDCCSP